MRLIDGDALIEAMRKEDKAYPELSACWSRGGISRTVKLLPTVDAVPVVHGRWKRGDMPTYGGYKCSVCQRNTVHYKANYCPNCGARMDGESSV